MKSKGKIDLKLQGIIRIITRKLSKTLNLKKEITGVRNSSFKIKSPNYPQNQTNQVRMINFIVIMQKIYQKHTKSICYIDFLYLINQTAKTDL